MKIIVALELLTAVPAAVITSAQYSVPALSISVTTVRYTVHG